MRNLLDATPDFKAAWERLKAEMEWANRSGHGQFTSDVSANAAIVLKRIEEIEAFEVVTEILTVCDKRHPVTHSVDPEAGPWIVVDTVPAPLLYWSPVLGWMGRPQDAGVFVTYSDALDDAEQQQAYVMPMALAGVPV